MHWNQNKIRSTHHRKKKTRKKDSCLILKETFTKDQTKKENNIAA